MRREIKFRAWLANHKDPRMMFFDLREEELNVRYLIDKGSPIMQYTGLKDKNGVEIYEGDILKMTDPPLYSTYRHVVEWNEYLAQFIISSNGSRHGRPLHEEHSFLGFRGTHGNYGVEVIGNIHENPKLLDVE